VSHAACVNLCVCGLQVKLGEMTEELRRRILGMTDEDFHDEELPPGMGVEPE